MKKWLPYLLSQPFTLAIQLPIAPKLRHHIPILTLLLLPLWLSAQRDGSRAAHPDSTRAAHPDTSPLSKFGFGPELTLTSAPEFRIDTFTSAPDRTLARQSPFSLSYSSWLQQLLNNPKPYTFWIRCGIANRSDSTVSLSVYLGNLDYTDGWWVSPGHPDQRATSGQLRPPLPGSSLIRRQYHILPFTLPPHQDGELWVAIRQPTRQYNFNGLHLYSPDALGAVFGAEYEDQYADLVFQWLFHGFLLCQLLYTLFQWLIIRRKEYLYYLGYMTAIALYFLSKFESELGLPLLFTHFPLLKVYLAKTLLILPYFLYFRFVRYFLEMRQQYPLLNKWIRRMEYFLLLYMIADAAFIMLTSNQELQNTVFTAILLAVFLVSASFIVYLFRHRRPLIYFVLTGSLFVAIGNILGQLITYFQDYNHLPLGITNILIFPQVGVLLEILCFTAGLGYKNYVTEKEKIRNQERLIEQLQANELLQQRVQHIRNKIAQDLHDDIGSTLSSISILSGIALKEDSNDQTQLTMNEIKDSSILLMERMDDIVWSINPRNDSLENLLVRVRHFATTLFEARDIEYDIDIQDDIHEVLLPVDFRQHIYLVLKEAINNLVKYAGPTHAFLRVSFDHQHLEICVRDNGRGFDPSAARKGNGMPGMQRRADLMKARLNIQSAPGAGTTITLKVDLQ